MRFFRSGRGTAPKPDRRIYELTCTRLELRPDEIVFLDDVEAYVRGAREAGLSAVLFENNGQALAAIEALLGGKLREGKKTLRRRRG